MCRVVSLHLPAEAQCPVAQFRWLQHHHSGLGTDVWALDDISVTAGLYNTICLDFVSRTEAGEALEVHLGEMGGFCDRTNTLR